MTTSWRHPGAFGCMIGWYRDIASNFKPGAFTVAFLLLPFLTDYLLAPCLAQSDSERSVLLPVPTNLSNYQRPFDELSRLAQWRIMIHGLRDAPLDPRVWGIRVVDRSENRQLVPMRPFFLRASEQADFQLDKVLIDFKFRRVGKGMMHRRPDTYTPMIDIGFSGVYKKGAPGERALKDSSYLVRLSGSPLFDSGLFYSSHGKLAPIIVEEQLNLEAGDNYRVELLFDKNQLRLLLNNQELLVHSGKDFRTGLVSLTTDWHPAKIEKLHLTGSLSSTGESVVFEYSKAKQ